MKYCSNCGKELNDDAVVCVHCGCSVDGAPVTKTTNGLCIAGFICSFFIAIVGLILSIIGRNQVSKDPTQTGQGFATAGIVISIVSMVLTFLLYFIIFAAAIAAA